MSEGPGRVVPLHFELSRLVHRSVANLYSHLVTRPTGQAVRLGIESQIGEMGELCLSVLDFRQVAVLDYSCADETVAKLILRYQAEDRPADAYFVARGLAEHHLEMIEAVLERHGLALVAELDAGPTLLGAVDDAEREAWTAVERLGRASVAEVAEYLSASQEEVAPALDALIRRRVVLYREAPRVHYALTPLIPAGPS
ncbi:MAG TPA: hypothetical protein VF212_16610 [Longimicrobiales bacterium]